MGQAMKQSHIQVDQFEKSFMGNKNKTGKKLGLDSTESLRSDKKDFEQKVHSMVLPATQLIPTNVDVQVHTGTHMPQMHADISSRGNKNGNGPKLGSMGNEDGVQVHYSSSLQFEKSLESCDTIGDMNNVSKQRMKNIPETIKLEKVYSTDYNRWMYQNKARFRFIPYNDLLVYIGKEVIWGDIPNIVEAHNLIRNSGLPNFLQSQLNINRWKYHLHIYWDQQLVDLLHYGFPLDFDRSGQLQSTEINHKSAIDYHDHVSHYIAEELKHGAMYGPFDEKPFPCHTSPFLTRHKPNSDNRRVIVDLSWAAGQSVNDGVAKDRYLNTYLDLNYPSVDHIVDKLKQLGDSALLFKIDISRAFRHLRIDPGATVAEW